MANKPTGPITLKRGVVVELLMLAVFAALLLRVLLIQTLDFEKYQSKVIDQLTVESAVAADRGNIYDRQGRIGMKMMENESYDDFAKVVKTDYNLALRCIEGWTGTMTQTVAYPYSKRNSLGDRIILENTGYKILMAGESARGTDGNYFVRGCDFENQLMLMSRPCRMDGTPISTYLERIERSDGKNGVNLYS